MDNSLEGKRPTSTTAVRWTEWEDRCSGWTTGKWQTIVVAVAGDTWNSDTVIGSRDNKSQIRDSDMRRRDMASCYPTSAVQRLPMQDSSRIGYRAINGMNAPNPKVSHHQVTSSSYSPQMVNLVYLTVAEHNPPQSSDQVITFTVSIYGKQSLFGLINSWWEIWTNQNIPVDVTKILFNLTRNFVNLNRVLITSTRVSDSFFDLTRNLLNPTKLFLPCDTWSFRGVEKRSSWFPVWFLVHFVNILVYFFGGEK